MALMPIITRDDLNVIGRFLVQEIGQELVYQKHVATGKLRDSVEYRIKTNAGGSVSLEIWTENYGNFVESGRRPGAKRVPIASLVQWIKVKGLATGDKEMTRLAFAIQEKIYREGVPTSGGKRISGRRTGHLAYVIQSNEDEISNLLYNRIQDNIRAQMDRSFDLNQKRLRRAA